MKQKGISGILTVFLALVLWSAVLIPTVSAYNEFDENANLIYHCSRTGTVRCVIL